jgi:hypothetical protein
MVITHNLKLDDCGITEGMGALVITARRPLIKREAEGKNSGC